MLGNNSSVVYHVSLLPGSYDNYLLCPVETFQDAVHTRTQCTTPESICGSSAPSMLPDGSSLEATPPKSSLSTDIIVLEALLEAERDGVAAMNEVILILKLEIMQLATRIMQATQELEEVSMLHLKIEEVLLFLLSEAQGNPGSSLDTN